MKTISVCRILAGVMAPVLALGQPAGEPAEGRGGEMRRGVRPQFMEAWKSADRDRDGFLSLEEFGRMPRVEHLPEEKRARLFERLDKNGDGRLSREELWRPGRPRDGQPPPMQRLWELDVNRDGGVDFEEFQRGRLFRKLPPERQREVFDKLDTDKDGLITPRDKPEPPFRRGRPGHHPRLQGDPDRGRLEPRQMFRLLDADGDGLVSFEEFQEAPMMKERPGDKLRERFDSMDTDGDGNLSGEEFSRWLKQRQAAERNGGNGKDRVPGG